MSTPSTTTKDAAPAAAAIAGPGPRETQKTMTRIAFEQLFEHRLAVASLVVIFIFCAVAIGADAIAWALHIDPNAQDIMGRFGPWSSELRNGSCIRLISRGGTELL